VSFVSLGGALSNFTAEKLLSYCGRISRLHAAGKLADEDAAAVYLQLLSNTHVCAGESYESLSVEVQAALMKVLDEGDVNFYRKWFSTTAANSPRVRQITISDETETSIVTLVLEDTTDHAGRQFIVEPNHPARFAIESLRKHIGRKDKSNRNWSRQANCE